MQNTQAVVESIFASLNGPQAEAVRATEGPVLVLAGAGTGKTKVLTSRIAYLLASGRAFPSQILSVTFTNKAAKEMQHRITNMVGEQSAGLWLGTFHSIGLRILRRHTQLVNLPQNFTVIDTDDQVRLVKQIIIAAGFDEKKMPPQNIAGTIQRWKDQALTPEDVAAKKSDSLELQFYKTYQERLTTLGVVDFGDLLLHVITLFKQNPDVLADYQRRFRYILVDEYQDTNVAQYLWLRLLAMGHHNICCVGDDDQSIYGWRGAEVGNILKFEKDFSTEEKPATIVKLEQNYRSTPHILACASAVIANNQERLGKTLFTQGEAGEKVKIVSLWDERAEASYVTQEIEALHSLHKLSPEEMAVLVRAGHQTRAFEESFLQNGIPYRIIGGLRFYERKEIRDAIAYIRATMQPTNDLALERILNVPRRGIGDTTLDSLRQQSRDEGISLNKSIRKSIGAGTLKGKAKTALETFIRQLTEWRERLHDEPHDKVAEAILKESGYMAMWQEDKSADAPGRVENLKELISAISEFESLEAFLEHVSLVTDADTAPEGEMVSIMTMHGAKGLEFRAVFLCGWEEGLFPSQRAMDELGRAGLEEERRLAYVGITRAKQRLFITFAASRFIFGQVVHSIPSRFVDELPEEHSERLNLLNNMNSIPGSSGMGASQWQARGAMYKQAATMAGPAIRKDGMEVGKRVFHQKFGYGKVVEASGEHITVDFEKSSTRTLIADYLSVA